MVKYVLVTGGVLSGLGKGVIASSTGVIMKAMGFRVTSIKIDPYLNIDAGLMSPFEHGEVYVLDDGGEVDLDLGNYERFLNITLGRDNNITTGKIYHTIIEKERKGEYLGKTVQIVPHVCSEIQDWIQRVAQKPMDHEDEESEPDICIIELGGTVGDIESGPYVEAFRQFQFRVGKENFCSIHVSLVPVLGAVGEHKTKPTQQSVRELRALGISPDVIVCRSTNPLNKDTREKISLFCHVDSDSVIGCHDVSNIYRVPLMLHDQGLEQIILRKMHLFSPSKAPRLAPWETFAQRFDQLQEKAKSEGAVHIAMVGKYTDLQDAYASVIKALQHAAIEAEVPIKVDWIDSTELENSPPTPTPTTTTSTTPTTTPATTTTTTTATISTPTKLKSSPTAWDLLKKAQGILVPGGFGDRGVEGKVLAINYARQNKIPFLGICLGMQLAVVEFARNVIGLEGANSEEFDANTNHKVVVFMPEVSKTHMGATMRLGKRTTILKTEKYPDSIARKLYLADRFDERHRHRYEVNPALVPTLEKGGLNFVGEDETKERMEVVELPRDQHPFFLGVQYHPEFKSRPGKPSPPFVGLVLASVGKLDDFLSGKLKLNPSKPHRGGKGKKLFDE